MTADAGWEPWDSDRVYDTLWPETRDWADRREFWPATPVPAPSDGTGFAQPIWASDVSAPIGRVFLTYWVWAVGTPFVKIGTTQHRSDRDGWWRGNELLVRRRVAVWSTGCPWRLELLRFAIGGERSESTEHQLRSAGRMPAREWFDLRRLAQP